MSKQGRLFVISASSGTGKTTIAHELLKRDRNLVQSVSCTTRAPRGDEKSGRDYIFLSKATFNEIRKKGGFLEWANVFGKFYGTPKAKCLNYLKRGKNVLLLIDVQGAKQIKTTYPNAVFIFLAPPSKKELLRRLTKRGTDSQAEIKRRYQVATNELRQLNDLKLCDYRIVNRDIDVCRRVIEAIIQSEKKGS